MRNTGDDIHCDGEACGLPCRVGGAWYSVAVISNFMGLAFDEHATAGVLYSYNSAFYCVWFVVAFLVIDGSPFTIQKYLVSVPLSFLISLRTQIRMLLRGELNGFVFMNSIWTHWNISAGCWYCYKTCLRQQTRDRGIHVRLGIVKCNATTGLVAFGVSGRLRLQNF